MIDLQRVKKSFKEFINNYNYQDPGFNLKVVHTMHVVENAKSIAEHMQLSDEDIALAQLIAYLHDIGRFEELKTIKGFDSVRNDHALYASKILFDDNLIRNFILDDLYDNIIKKAIENHNKLNIESGLNERELLHAKIIRDADKLDNYRVKRDESIEELFLGKFSKIEEFNDSLISDNVYNSVLKRECVDIHDRVYPLDYWICILAFVFDLNFKETFDVIKDNNYVDILIDKFKYTNKVTSERMEKIRSIINEYVREKTN